MRIPRTLVILALAGAFFTQRARGSTREWNVASGVWNVAGNWNPAGVPGSGDFALVDFPNGNAQITTNDQPAVGSVSVQNGGSISITNHGVLTDNGDFIVADADSAGTLNMLTTQPGLAFPGGLTVSGNLRLGVNGGQGYINQNAGTILVGNEVVVGDSSGTTNVGSGDFALNGVATLQAMRLTVDVHQYSDGLLSLGGFATVNVEALVVGGQAQDPGFGVVQTGGQMNVSSFFQLDDAGGVQYTLSGGSLNCAATVIGDLQFASVATLNYNGGNASLGDLLVEDGGSILLSGGANKVLRINSLVDDNGVIDLANNSMLDATDPPTLVTYFVEVGYGAGDWKGAGITSDFAAATALLGLPHATALGLAPSGAGTLVKYVFAGDANLDDAVDSVDFNALAASFGGAGKLWYQGDFNYDLSVDTTDFNLLASNFGEVMSAQTNLPGGATLLPEPLLAGPLLLGLIFLRRRRR